MSRFARTAIAVAILVGAASAAMADSVADFYKGKTVTIIVGYPPASGYTLYGQMLAKYWSDHIPGQPNVIVQSMPGAGSIKAANYLYSVAPKDGTRSVSSVVR
jgi:tripartite-type tricarboxylate transporter receptor subunit TctC